MNLKLKIASDGAKMMFYLSNVAIGVNVSQPSVRIGGGLHALIHIFFFTRGLKSSKPHWDLKQVYIFPTDFVFVLVCALNVKNISGHPDQRTKNAGCAAITAAPYL